jgi:hypothetical protein
MNTENKKLSLGRSLLMWLGSWLIIGFCMFYYFGMPVVPLISVGIATLVITLGRHFLLKR